MLHCTMMVWFCVFPTNYLVFKNTAFGLTIRTLRPVPGRRYVECCDKDVRIDSLGIVACNLNPKDICEGIAWLAEGSKPAYI